MALALFAPPVALPLTRDEAKEFLRVDHGDEDTLIESLIKQVVGSIEGRESPYGLALITQTWDETFDGFPTCSTDPITTSLAPVQSVTSVKYLDTAGVEQTWSPLLYTVDAKSLPARILPAYGQSYPSVRLAPNAVTVRFVAGYGATADAVPEPLRGIVRRAVLHAYDQRNAAGLPDDVHRALTPYRLSWSF